MKGYGKIAYFNSSKARNVLLAMFGLMMIVLMNPVALAVSIQKFGIDSKTYAEGDLITVSGEIVDGNASGEIKIVIWQGDQFPEDAANETTNTTTNATDGIFSASITAPSNSGEYNIAAIDMESGIKSPWLNFDVLGINDPRTIKIVLTEGNVIAVPLSGSSGITGPLASGKTGGSVSIDGNTYYFLVSNDNVAYLDDDSDMNLTSDNSGNPVVGNLVEGSKVKLNATTYTFIHIYNMTQLVLARPVIPSFSGGESVNATLLPLNLTNIPLNNTVISLNFIKSDGTSVITNVTTDSNGIGTTNISVPTDSGVCHLIAGNVGHLSFVVDTVDMFGDLFSMENKPKHTFARGETFIAVAYIKNRTSGEPISTASVTAKISGASLSYDLTLTFDSSLGAYTANYTIPVDAPLDSYNVKYTAIIGTQTQYAYTGYDLKAYDLFLKAVSKESDESDGFAPGKEAFLLLAGTDLSNGTRLDIYNLTDSLNTSKFKLNITDSRGKSINAGNWTVMDLTNFYSYMNVPTDVQDEISRKMGTNVTIINFTAPSENGIYDIAVQVNLTQWATVRTSISVQDIFVRGEPVNKNGWFNPRIAPGAYARLLIMAFDPSTGGQLAADKINDAGLVEVWSESANDVVTQYMLNSTLETIDVPFMGQVKVLKFQVNDSYLGFHFVKFWVNASVGGVNKTVIGNGWFDEKLYTIKARPVFNEGTGMFRTFGGNDDISLSVYVEDMSGNNVSGATIEIQNVKYGMTGENVPLNTSSSSFTTGSNGSVTVTFDPTGSLKSGFYNVRIKMTTQEGVTDYGNGWFDVRNFIFFTYSTSWDAAVGKPIEFSLNAYDSNFQNKSVNVTLTRINSMGNWEMMTPPSVFNETDVNIGQINGTSTYEYPGISKGGDYEFVFEASDGSTTEVGYAWVHVTPFIAWVDTYGKYEFSTSGFMNFSVVASGDKFGGIAPHNITNITIEKVMQEGMYMTTYRNKSQMSSITNTSVASANRMNVSVNTTGWGQGGYSMYIKVKDDQGSEIYTQFWFQLNLASVTVPELMRMTINGGKVYTNTTAVNATSDLMSNKNEFANESVGTISAGKVSGPVINDQPITMIVGEGGDQVVDTWNHTLVPYFSMVVVDTVNRTVYIEFENQSNPGTQYYNLSNNVTTQVFNKSVNDTFTDYTGRTWKILEVTSDGTVKLQGLNTLKNGLMMNESVMAQSKSGKFLMGRMYDEEWRNIDLDGDGEYFGQDDRYNVLMLDIVESGVYNKVYISNISNFSSGTYIDASSGAAVTFGGDPIYLLANKYESGAYILDFTTYRKGWGGMNLGTYANGSIIKIPFLVLKPDGTPVSNSNVSIDFLMDESRDKFLLTGINNTTDSKGLTIISINSSNTILPTGAWMIYYNSSIGSEYATADEDMFWQMPRFELRNFMVSGALGVPGNINLTRLNDDDTTDGLPGNNILIGFGDEIEFRRGIGTWWNDGEKYQLEYPFEKWYYNNTTHWLDYSPNWGSFVYVNDTLINSTSARNVISYNVTTINNEGDLIELGSGITTFSGMWIFNVTSIGAGSTTIAMSYEGWPWTMPGGGPGSQGPMVQVFNEDNNWWMGGLDFTVDAINEGSNTVTLRLNRPVMVAEVASAAVLLDDNISNGELKKMRGSVNKVTFNSKDYLVYGYEDKASTSADGLEYGYMDTMDSVLVEDLNNSTNKSYRIGVPIPELDNYYAASVPDWGGKLVLVNNSTTQVFPIPQWGADDPIYYTGTFSDMDIGADLATLGGGGGEIKGNITEDKRYSIFMFDTTPNGINFPTQATYDDDPDLTMLGEWGGMTPVYYDMYGPERGYGDALPEGMYDPMNPVLVNMSEKQAWDIGTGNMESWPMAIPTIKINGSYSARTFIQKKDFDKKDNITLYVSAKDFTGIPVNGTANLTKLKMSFGGSYNTGPFEDLPLIWPISNVSVTLTDGEGLIKVEDSDIPADLKPEGSHDFSFGEFTAFIDVIDNTGRTETLKTNFFMMDKSMEKGGGPSSGGGEGGMI